MLLDLSVSSTERLAGMAGCAVVFTVLTWLLFRRFGHYRLIADTPTAQIRSAPQGYVELNGALLGTREPPLRSPLSDRECVWYRTRVDRYQSNSNGKGGRWSSVHQATSADWLKIDDGSGICLVDPAGARVSTAYKRTWFGSTPNPTPNAFGSHRLGSSVFSLTGSSRYRYTEELMFQHERLYALGAFRSVGGGRDRLDLKQVSGTLLRDWKSDQAGLLQRFDRNGDGQIDLNEWEQAREQALAQARAQQGEMDRLPTQHLLAAPEQSDQPYLLSTYSEQALLRRYRWIVGACLIGLAGAVWFGLELLLTRPLP